MTEDAARPSPSAPPTANKATGSEVPAAPMAAGEVYSRLIETQLNEERTHRNSLESRGVTVVTTSGTLATLLFALTAGITSAQKFKLPTSAKLPLILALCAFILAAILGLVTNIPRGGGTVSPEELERILSYPLWETPAEEAKREVAGLQIKVILKVRAANYFKAKVLVGGISLELLAVFFLAWGISVIILTG